MIVRLALRIICYIDVRRLVQFGKGAGSAQRQTQDGAVQVLLRVRVLPVRQHVHVRARRAGAHDAPARPQGQEVQELPHSRVLPVRGALQLPPREERPAQEEEEPVQVPQNPQWLRRPHSRAEARGQGLRRCRAELGQDLGILGGVPLMINDLNFSLYF